MKLIKLCFFPFFLPFPVYSLRVRHINTPFKIKNKKYNNKWKIKKLRLIKRRSLFAVPLFLIPALQAEIHFFDGQSTIYPYNGGIPAYPTDASGSCSRVSSENSDCRIAPLLRLSGNRSFFYYSRSLHIQYLRFMLACFIFFVNWRKPRFSVPLFT